MNKAKEFRNCENNEGIVFCCWTAQLLCPRPSSKSNQTFILLFENGKNDCLIDCCAVGRPREWMNGMTLLWLFLLLVGYGRCQRQGLRQKEENNNTKQRNGMVSLLAEGRQLHWIHNQSNQIKIILICLVDLMNSIGEEIPFNPINKEKFTFLLLIGDWIGMVGLFFSWGAGSSSRRRLVGRAPQRKEKTSPRQLHFFLWAGAQPNPKERDCAAKREKI